MGIIISYDKSCAMSGPFSSPKWAISLVKFSGDTQFEKYWCKSTQSINTMKSKSVNGKIDRQNVDGSKNWKLGIEPTIRRNCVEIII